MKNKFYTMEDLFHAVAPFGSMDANALLDRCNEWGIHPADVVEYAQDNFEYSPKVDDLAYNINVLFDALFHIRLAKLNDICLEAIEEANKDNKIEECKELSKLLEFLQDKATEYIHINAMCSCFDNSLLSDLEGVLSSEDLLEYLEKVGDFNVNR